MEEWGSEVSVALASVEAMAAPVTVVTDMEGPAATAAVTATGDILAQGTGIDFGEANMRL
jgi:hypothetical protein